MKLILKFIGEWILRIPPLLSVFRRRRFKGKNFLVNRTQWTFKEKNVVEGCDGISYALDLDDDVQRCIYFDTISEFPIDQILLMIPTEGICLDVGANVGYYTMQFGRKVRNRGQVYSFEPDPKVYRKLGENIRLNNYENVHAYQLGVSDKDGEGEFFRSSGDHSGWGSLIKYEDVTVETIRIRTVTLDSFLKKLKIERVDFLKIDVEGNEFEVIEGARKALENHVVKTIFVEFNGPRLSERAKSLGQFVEMFDRHRYKAYGRTAKIISDLHAHPALSRTTVANFLFTE